MLTTLASLASRSLNKKSTLTTKILSRWKLTISNCCKHFLQLRFFYILVFYNLCRYECSSIITQSFFVVIDIVLSNFDSDSKYRHLLQLFCLTTTESFPLDEIGCSKNVFYQVNHIHAQNLCILSLCIPN